MIASVRSFLSFATSTASLSTPSLLEGPSLRDASCAESAARRGFDSEAGVASVKERVPTGERSLGAVVVLLSELLVRFGHNEGFWEKASRVSKSSKLKGGGNDLTTLAVEEALDKGREARYRRGRKSVTDYHTHVVTV